MDKEFLRAAIQYFGKEIELPSKEEFTIDSEIDEELAKEEKFRYYIQYGKTVSGCVFQEVLFDRKENIIRIEKTSVFVPTEDDILISNIMPGDVENNPLVIDMIRKATADLEEAKEIGPCTETVDPRSNRIKYATTKQNGFTK